MPTVLDCPVLGAEPRYQDPVLRALSTPSDTSAEPDPSSTEDAMMLGNGGLTSDEWLPILDLCAFVSPAQYAVSPTVEVGGEAFAVEVDEGTIYLSHPRWSLLGEGASLIEAEANLMEEARALLPVFLAKPITALSEDARALRDFLLRVA